AADTGHWLGKLLIEGGVNDFNYFMNVLVKVQNDIDNNGIDNN
ncbi:258_t:CDS:1, partial [Dentiscutata heterogama]